MPQGSGVREAAGRSASGGLDALRAAALRAATEPRSPRFCFGRPIARRFIAPADWCVGKRAENARELSASEQQIIAPHTLGCAHHQSHAHSWIPSAVARSRHRCPSVVILTVHVVLGACCFFGLSINENVTPRESISHSDEGGENRQARRAGTPVADRASVFERQHTHSI